MTKKKHLHFLGIGGSGCSAVAVLARQQGFKVSGCDLNPDSPYLDNVLKAQIPVLEGHNDKHLQGVDALIISPAVLAINPPPPEIILAQKKKIILTWQEFLGRTLQKDKQTIAVAGTHGKTTTTALVSLIFEQAGFRPSVVLGGIVPDWGANFRQGDPPYFICEADEYNNNFLHYTPEIAVITNLEMDHPEFFPDFESLLLAFEKFALSLTGRKILIVNANCPGLKKLLQKIKSKLFGQGISVIGYGLFPEDYYPFETFFLGQIKQRDRFFTEFEVIFGLPGQPSLLSESFKLKLPGAHNVSNALAAFSLAWALNLKIPVVKKVFENFAGVKRRFDLVSKVGQISIFDDYGHHPTQIAATIAAARQKFPKLPVWAIFEPHQASRLRLFTREFLTALKNADEIIVAPIFWGREEPSPGLTAREFADKFKSGHCHYFACFESIADFVKKNLPDKAVVLVFGAGKSYRLSRLIASELKND